MPVEKKQVLHVGCGAFAPGKLHPAFGVEEWSELRLDIDGAVAPDIVASITDMAEVTDGSVDAVFSSHNLEHLYPHEVPLALAEFRRVLKPAGFALVTMPDLQSVARLVADGRLTDPAYISGLGPITPLDMLYGFGPALAADNLFMAHHTGFTGRSLQAALSGAGFGYSVVQRDVPRFCLWAIAFVEIPGEETLQEAQNAMLPLHAVLARMPKLGPAELAERVGFEPTVRC